MTQTLLRQLGADGWEYNVVDIGGGGGGGGAPSGPAGGFLTGTYPDPDPPAWWTVDSTPGSESVEFAGAVTISPSDPGIDVLTLSGSGTAAVRIVDGLATIVSDDDKAITLTDVASWANAGDGIYWEPDGLGSGSASFFVGADYVLQAEAAKLGFFGHTAVTRPTGVAVTAGGIHAALVSLGLIAA